MAQFSLRAIFALVAVAGVATGIYRLVGVPGLIAAALFLLSCEFFRGALRGSVGMPRPVWLLTSVLVLMMSLAFLALGLEATPSL